MPIMQPTMPQRENIGISARLFEGYKIKTQWLMCGNKLSAPARNSTESVNKTALYTAFDTAY